ncbi:MAG: alpha/beta fold hydrolase [Sporichthyaceae bacterium]|nr:alpha/beta fold hydrolase [Sporichthyaceae bacterium]
MFRVVGVAVTVIVVILALLWAFQRQLVYFPTQGAVPPAATVLPGAREVVLETDDGLSLNAWYLPAEHADRGMGVLVANGNAGDRSARAPLAEALSARGLTVLLFDYRGYGENPGSPSEQGLARDARAAYRFLVEEVGIGPERLVYFGESLGAAVVTELATERPPAGLVLRSPFVDLASVGHSHYPFLPVRALLRDRYPLAEQLAAVSAPVTVVYGSEDSVVPAEQSRAVAKAAPTLHDVVEVAGADHNDHALLVGKQLIDAVVTITDHASRPWTEGGPAPILITGEVRAREGPSWTRP